MALADIPMARRRASRMNVVPDASVDFRSRARLRFAPTLASIARRRADGDTRFRHSGHQCVGRSNLEGQARGRAFGLPANPSLLALHEGREIGCRNRAIDITEGALVLYLAGGL